MRAQLIRLILLAAATGCGPSSRAPPPAAASPAARSHGLHMQVVRAMPAHERLALVERFRARNGAWAITLGTRGAPDDVDPIRGVVRRATRDAADIGQTSPVTEASAITEAAAFLRKNAAFLGLSTDDVAALDLAAGPAKTTTYGAWVVHARGKTPMRGYEGFEAVASAIDVLLYIGEDGATRYFVNLSRVHPRLSLDTAPTLGPDDRRLLANVVGRPVFVVVSDSARPEARVRELRRVPLGDVVDADVRAIRLTIHVSPGLRLAYVTYALAYAVDVVKAHQTFRFVVDADTGALLEDAVVPVVDETATDEE